jgi:hypothetical protein
MGHPVRFFLFKILPVFVFGIGPYGPFLKKSSYCKCPYVHVHMRNKVVWSTCVHFFMGILNYTLKCGSRKWSGIK